MAENHKEIERIWILPKMPGADVLNDSPSKGGRCNPIPHKISYLFSTAAGEMRVVKRFFDTGNKYSLTVKNRGDMIRDEWEDDNIPSWVYEITEPNAECGVFKIRHFVRYGKYTLEIDEYQSRFSRSKIDTGVDLCKFEHVNEDVKGKLRLECEFPSKEEAEKFELPLWAAGAKEVTSNRLFKNSVIAKDGWQNERWI